MTAQLLVMSAAEYHAGAGCPTPALSSSIAQALTYKSPAHAYAMHPKLGGQRTGSERRMEIGSVAHKLALGAGSEVSIISADSYRTKAAQEARDAAIAAGTLPILQDDYDAAEALAKPLAEAAAQYMGAPISECLTERVILWQDGATQGWRRVMMDLMSPDYRVLCDLKTTLGSAAPDECARRMYSGYHIQRAFYERAVDELDPAGIGLRKFGFIFAEQAAPHGVSPPIELSEAGLHMGRKAVARACKIWDECVRSGEWPGYSREVHVAEPPAYSLSLEMENADA